MNTVRQYSEDTHVLKLELTVEDINIVLSALQELPHRVSDSIIRKVIEQAQSQLQAESPLPEGASSAQ